MTRWCGLCTGTAGGRTSSPRNETKSGVESRLEQLGWKVDVVLSHTAPLKYEPVEAFLNGVDQSQVDRSMEQWLDRLEDRLDYGKWYCGHFHTEKKIDRVEIMFENFDLFCNETGEGGVF